MNSDAYLPSIDNLRCFVALADRLNFRQAANHVHLTPTAFSQRIKQLEEQLDVVLFERTTRRVVLTSAGLCLLPTARATLDMARQCIEAVHPDREPPASFTIGTRFELGISWVVPAISEIERIYPSWRIDTYFGSGPDIVARLLAGDVQCVVTSAPIARAEWTAHVLHPETYSFVGSPELLANTPFQTAEDARNHTLLDVDQALPLTRYLMDADGPSLAFADVRFCGVGAAMLQLALRGAGVAVLPDYMVKDHIANGTLVKLLPSVELLTDSFRLLYPKGAPQSAAFDALAEHLRQKPLC